MKKRTICLCVALVLMITCLAGCEGDPSGTRQNVQDTKTITDTLTARQPTTADLDYSLERYNLIRRAYWVNGQREKASTFPCPVERPLGYIVLFTGNATVSSFVVDGKVSSLNSYLSPNYDERYYKNGATITTELADVDGSYGENDTGIFFFTPDGKYVEWTGDYLYSDIPFVVDTPVVTYRGN